MNLYNIDCLQFLSTQTNDSAGMVLTDPPYYRIMKHEWDRQWKTEQEYLDWCKQWTSECVRILKPNRCIAVWGTTKTDTFLKYKLEVLNSFPELVYQNWIIWSYDWGGRTKKTFARKHEDLYIYSKGEDFIFNADDIRIPYVVEKNVRKGAENNPLGKIPTDVWQKNNHTTSKEYVGWHPTQKPISLLERLIKAYTNRGETVVDIFSGSGSTMIACHNAERDFEGCELDIEYYNKSLERVEMMKNAPQQAAKKKTTKGKTIKQKNSNTSVSDLSVLSW